MTLLNYNKFAYRQIVGLWNYEMFGQGGSETLNGGSWTAGIVNWSVGLDIAILTNPFTN